MTTYSLNLLLVQSAQNHANYIKNNIYAIGYEGHYETSNNPGYTGYAPWDRAYATGYKTSASENLTVGYGDYKTSIDGLFTAIYHRFGFLDFTTNEIGYGESLNTQNGNLYTHVYNLGNKELNLLCTGVSFNGFGSYYKSVCSDTNFKIEASLYESEKNKSAQKNPSIVVWPYENQTDFQTSFFEESPDPLPTCSVTGNPISIQFNPATTGNIVMQSFKLYNTHSTPLSDVTLLNKSTDPNAELSAKEFALFPMQRLEYGKKYRAEFVYKENTILKTKSWNFYTVSLPYDYYVITQNTTDVNVRNGVRYMLYIPPTNCNDSRLSLKTVYTTSKPPVLNIVDGNLMEITLNGNIGEYEKITLANGKTINVTVAISDTAINHLDTDGDGLPNSYEILYGLDTSYNDANFDLDNDGKTNLEEYNKNTDPNDATSKYFTLQLEKNWNFVSLPLKSFLNLTKLNNPYIKTIRSFQNDQWYVWTHTKQKTIELLLTSLEDGYGYWIETSQATSLNILGKGTPKIQKIKSNQWNMLGSQNIVNMRTYFAEHPTVKVLWTYNALTHKWQGISSDNVINQTIMDENITAIDTIKANEAFMVR